MYIHVLSLFSPTLESRGMIQVEIKQYCPIRQILSSKKIKGNCTSQKKIQATLFIVYTLTGISCGLKVFPPNSYVET